MSIVKKNSFIGVAYNGIRVGKLWKSDAATVNIRMPVHPREPVWKSIVATPLLYEVTSEYGMEIQLGKDCDILQILVGPKFFWNEHVSGWVEPEHRVSLPLAQYEEILRKIEQLKPLGALIKTTRNLFVTNSKVHYWDEYETGFVQRLLRCCPIDDEPQLLFSFTIYFAQRLWERLPI